MSLNKVAFKKDITLNGDILLVPTGNCNFLGLQIAGAAWTGTLTLEASVDGINFGLLGVHNAPDGVLATSYTVNGTAFSNDIAAFQAFRVRASAAITGTANVTVLVS